jgi:hypothetical protein
MGDWYSKVKPAQGWGVAYMSAMLTRPRGEAYGFGNIENIKSKEGK